jgi:guanidinopropionase
VAGVDDGRRAGQSIPDLAASASAFHGGPILRALAGDGPLGLILFDSHTDLFHSYYGGYLYMHGTPFRRAVEEGLIDPRRVVMIGMRGTTYDSEDRRFADSAGIRVIPIEEYFRRYIEDVMVEARAIVADRPTYASFDIDFDIDFDIGLGSAGCEASQ